MVTHADENGFLSFLRVGGWRADVLVGQRRRAADEQGLASSGVVGRKASRPLRRGEEFRRVELEDLHLDIGARSREEALELVAIGRRGRDRRRAGRARERAHRLALAGQPARRVRRARGGAAGRPTRAAGRATSSRSRPSRRRSATSAARARACSRSSREVALAVDITGATDAPGGDPKIDGAAVLGAGPILNRGSTIAPRVFDLLVEAAEARRDPVRGERVGGLDAHRHGRGLPQPCGDRDGPRLDPDPVHALSGRDRRARGRRGGDSTGRGVRRRAARAPGSTSTWLARVAAMTRSVIVSARPHAVRQARRRPQRLRGDRARRDRDPRRARARRRRARRGRVRDHGPGAAGRRRPGARAAGGGRRRACRSSCPPTRSTRSAPRRSARSRSPTR